MLDTTGSPANPGDVANQAIRMNCVVGCGAGGGTSSTFGAAFPATGTAGGYFDGVNMQGGRVHDLDTGAGTEYNVGVTPRCLAAGGSTPCFPPTFLSAGAIANQVATAIHGFTFIYDPTLNQWDPAANHKRANTSGAGVQAVGMYVRGVGAGNESTPLSGASTTTDNNSGNGYAAVSLNALNSTLAQYDRLRMDNILGGLFVAATQVGTWSFNLPTGASTSANQATEIANLVAILAKLPALIQNAQPVFVTYSAVPVEPNITPFDNKLTIASRSLAYCRAALCPPSRGGLR